MPTEKLTAQNPSSVTGVDREKKVLRGYVVAQQGDFNNKARGHFNGDSLSEIVSLANAKKNGLKSRFKHPTLSSDGLGNFLGRAKDFRLDKTTTFDGETVPAVRADLHFSDTAFDSPSGNLGKYVMDLAEDDPEAMSTSLVLHAEKTQQFNEDDEPTELLWMPTRLFASDVVDTGEAVDGILSAELDADKLTDEMVRKGYELLMRFLPSSDRSTVEERLNAWLQRALDLRFGETKITATNTRDTSKIDERRKVLDEIKASC